MSRGDGYLARFGLDPADFDLSFLLDDAAEVGDWDAELADWGDWPGSIGGTDDGL